MMTTRFHRIGAGFPAYLLAELSHNHQGSGAEALELIRAAAAAGAQAIKFQKRDNETLFDAAFLETPYTGSNSFGATYGEHRRALEPSIDWLLPANKLAHSLGLDFVMTVFDRESLLFCERYLSVDVYKIQSGDLNHPALIRAVAAVGKPYFISCGAASLDEIQRAYHLCSDLKTPFVLLYAVSAYPTPESQVHLGRLRQLQEVLGTREIGFSCHYKGIKAAMLSRMFGASVIEKHFTRDKMQKGPDHAISLLPDELADLKDQLAALDVIMGRPFPESGIETYQSDARYKMGKSAVAVRMLHPGAVVRPEDVRYTSPGGALSPAGFEMYLGRRLKVGMMAGQRFESHFFEP